MRERYLSSPGNPLVKHLVRLRDDRGYRTSQSTVLIQGRKMISELGRERSIKLLIVTDESLVPDDLPFAELIIASDEVLQKISGVNSSEGIVAEVERPPYISLAGHKRILALDGLADPGNVGTLLRTALALGWDGVYLLDNCCDPYNDKALRSAMGATFRLPLQTGDAATLQQLAKQSGWQCFAADLQGQPPSAMARPDKLLLVLGSESHGVSPDCRAFCEPVTIPMPGAMESLNVSVAGAILMYLLGPSAIL